MSHFSKEKLLGLLSLRDSTDIDSRDKIAQFLINTFYKKDKYIDNFHFNRPQSCDNLNETKMDLFDLNSREILPGFALFTLTTACLLSTVCGRKLYLRIYLAGALASFLNIFF